MTIHLHPRPPSYALLLILICYCTQLLYHTYLACQLSTTQTNQPLYATKKYLSKYITYVPVQHQQQTIYHYPLIGLSPKPYTYNSIIQPKIWHHTINQLLCPTISIQKVQRIGSTIMERLYWWQLSHNTCLFKINMKFCDM